MSSSGRQAPCWGTFVGSGAGEFIRAATITAGVPVHRLRHAVSVLPTTSEICLRLIESVLSEVLRLHLVIERKTISMKQGSASEVGDRKD